MQKSSNLLSFGLGFAFVEIALSVLGYFIYLFVFFFFQRLLADTVSD